MPNVSTPDRLLIIIPAYNEQGAIFQVVSGVRYAVPDADVLVINDGSVDKTAQAAEAAGALVVAHPFNLGIGGAVQTGLKFARDQGYDYVIRLDGDGQHNADEIQLFLQVLRSQAADMVIGSRFLNADVDWHIPWARRIGINYFGWAVSLLIGGRATDTTSGFCGMNRAAVDVLATYLPQDYPDVESRVIVHKAGLRQMELPVNMRARVAGVSSINTWKSIYYAFKVSVAMVTSAMKDIAPHARFAYVEPGDLAATSARTASQRAGSQNGNGHYLGVYQANGHQASRNLPAPQGLAVNGVASTAAAPMGTDLVQSPRGFVTAATA